MIQKLEFRYIKSCVIHGFSCISSPRIYKGQCSLQEHNQLQCRVISTLAQFSASTYALVYLAVTKGLH